MSVDDLREITRCLERVASGRPEARDELIEKVHDRLRAMAGASLRNEGGNRTLDRTALVHEAWLRLFPDDETSYNHRNHFLAAAAEAMRRILVDRARERLALKRGQGRRPVTFEDIAVLSETPAVDILDLDAAVTALEQHEENLAAVVRLRFFAGLSVEETASALGIGTATVKRQWRYARAWLYERMNSQQS